MRTPLHTSSLGSLPAFASTGRAVRIMLSAVAVMAATTSATAQRVVVIKAGHVITASGEEIPRGVIVISDGVVELVGLGLEYPAGAEVIDATTETVMPGLIHAGTRGGLGNVSRTGVNAHLSPLDELHPGALDEDRFLRSGFTTIGLIPAGTGLPGTAAAYRLAGPDDARVLNSAAYLRVTMSRMPGDKTTLAGALRRAKAEIEKVEKARKDWEAKQEEERKKAEAERAQQQQQQQSGQPSGTQPAQQPAPRQQPQQLPQPAKFEPPKIDPPHEPIVNLMEKKPGPAMVLEVASASDVVHALDVMKDWKDVAYSMSLSGGSDFNYIVERLGEKKFDVLVDPTIARLPNTVIRYNLPGELARAGCNVAFSPASDSSFALENYLAFTADVVRSGMPREAAIKALTIEPAKRLRVDDKIGSIQKGRQADIVFFTGDPLDPASRVTRVMINGEFVWEASR